MPMDMETGTGLLDEGNPWKSRSIEASGLEVDGAVAATEANEASPASETPPRVQADTVELTGNVGQIEARLVNVQRGGIGQVRGGDLTVTLTNGGIGAMAAHQINADIKNGGVGAMAARQAELRDTTVSVLAAARVNLSGNARVLFDVRAGLVFGAVAGGVLGLINLVVRLVLREKTTHAFARAPMAASPAKPCE